MCYRKQFSSIRKAGIDLAMANRIRKQTIFKRIPVIDIDKLVILNDYS